MSCTKRSLLSTLLVDLPAPPTLKNMTEGRTGKVHFMYILLAPVFILLQIAMHRNITPQTSIIAPSDPPTLNNFVFYRMPCTET
eukprot:1150552-Pelagomonas_calceolata.AAC.2